MDKSIEILVFTKLIEWRAEDRDNRDFEYIRANIDIPVFYLRQESIGSLVIKETDIKENWTSKDITDKIIENAVEQLIDDLNRTRQKINKLKEMSE